MLKRIKIEKLFDTFSYDIRLKEEGITILTGPNGYGKTTILKMLYALSIKDPFFFVNLLFKSIELEFDDRDRVRIAKKNEAEIEITDGKHSPISLGKTYLYKKVDAILKENSLLQIDEEHWVDIRTDNVLSKEMFLKKYLPYIPNHMMDTLGNKESQKGFPSALDVYLIREQRLLRRVLSRPGKDPRFYIEEKFMDAFGETIEEYARELGNLITQTLAKSSQVAQELDSSFPRRLFDQQNEISEDDFKVRFEKVKDIQKALSRYGLSIIKDDNHPIYKQENAKALWVYLDDTEKKLEVFSNLIEKLDVFTSILNERRFVYKQIEISKDDGFKFKTDQGTYISLTELSSGEQQEVVLLYELLFKVNPGTLVLIDEPEISLHVAWQKEFLNDLLRIVELQKVNIITATHSPQIINNRWDLTVDLEEISK